MPVFSGGLPSFDTGDADQVFAIGGVGRYDDVEGAIELFHRVVAAMDLGHDSTKLLDPGYIENSLFQQRTDQPSTVVGVHGQGINEQRVVDVDCAVERSGAVGDNPNDPAGIGRSDVDRCVAASGCDFVSDVGTDELFDVAGVPETPVSANERS